MKSHRTMRADAAHIWSAALRSVDPEPAIRSVVKRRGRVLRVAARRFDLGSFEKVWVLGAGKAAASMGCALENILGRHLAGGLLVTKYGHSAPTQKLEVVEAGHPLPDENGIAAAARMISLINEETRAGDLVFFVLSGGASSLLVSPAPGISLADKLKCTQLLLNGGADIYELNAVRKHLSGIKGGGLGRLLMDRKVVCLVLSDVVGDDVATIASGPLAPDPTTYGDSIDILQRLNLFDCMPETIRKRLELGSAGLIAETPKRGDPAFRSIETCIVGSCAQACTTAARTAQKLGYKTLILTSRLDGDNESAARFHMRIAGEIVFQRRPVRRPCCIITGGETTVTVTGAGKGGRNQEFALHCVRHLANLPAPCIVASLGTDGTDGPTDAAGAIADNTTLSRSIKFGAHFLKESLENNDSYNFFKRLGDLIITGPTRTNVMDLHLVLIG